GRRVAWDRIKVRHAYGGGGGETFFLIAKVKDVGGHSGAARACVAAVGWHKQSDDYQGQHGIAPSTLPWFAQSSSISRVAVGAGSRWAHRRSRMSAPPAAAFQDNVSRGGLYSPSRYMDSEISKPTMPSDIQTPSSTGEGCRIRIVPRSCIARSIPQSA